MVPAIFKAKPVIMICSALIFSSSVALAAGEKLLPKKPSSRPPANENSLENHTDLATSKPSFHILPPEVTLPPGVPLGKYRRTIHPFPNWILVCDENLKNEQKICNASQTIARADNSVVFSWSLAATQNGQPYFILRAPPSVGIHGSFTIKIPDGGKLVSLGMNGCSKGFCIAYQPAGPRLRNAVRKRLNVTISYASPSSSGAITITVPLDGLTDALAAI